MPIIRRPRNIAAILSTLLFTAFPQDIAWRTLFWVGLAPAFIVFFLRRFVEDPPVFKAARENIGAGGLRQRPFEIFSPELIRTTILTCLLATGAQGGYYALFTWLPTYLKVERKLSVIGSGGYIAVVIVGSFIGYLVSAYLTDVIGRRANFLIYAVSSVVTVFVYTQLPIDDTLMLFLGFPLGFFACGIFSGMGPFLTENFPTRMRGSGQGFAYNFGRGLAALNPTFVGLLSATLPSWSVNRCVQRCRLRTPYRRGLIASRDEGTRADGRWLTRAGLVLYASIYGASARDLGSVNSRGEKVRNHGIETIRLRSRPY
jgi:MFS family permease